MKLILLSAIVAVALSGCGKRVDAQAAPTGQALTMRLHCLKEQQTMYDGTVLVVGVGKQQKYIDTNKMTEVITDNMDCILTAPRQ